ncbi:MAG: hypothetical protein R2867_16740 [Caldilineaceae bacterium]
MKTTPSAWPITAADMWSDFGIEVDLQGLERSVWDQNNFVGQFNVTTPWTSFALAFGRLPGRKFVVYTQISMSPMGEDFPKGGGNSTHQRSTDR